MPADLVAGRERPLQIQALTDFPLPCGRDVEGFRADLHFEPARLALGHHREAGAVQRNRGADLDRLRIVARDDAHTPEVFPLFDGGDLAHVADDAGKHQRTSRVSRSGPTARRSITLSFGFSKSAASGSPSIAARLPWPSTLGDCTTTASSTRSAWISAAERIGPPSMSNRVRPRAPSASNAAMRSSLLPVPAETRSTSAPASLSFASAAA